MISGYSFDENARDSFSIATMMRPPSQLTNIWHSHPTYTQVSHDHHSSTATSFLSKAKECLKGNNVSNLHLIITVAICLCVRATPFSRMCSNSGVSLPVCQRTLLEREKSILHSDWLLHFSGKFGFWNSALCGNTKCFNTALIPLQGQ